MSTQEEITRTSRCLANWIEDMWRYGCRIDAIAMVVPVKNLYIAFEYDYTDNILVARKIIGTLDPPIKDGSA